MHAVGGDLGDREVRGGVGAGKAEQAADRGDRRAGRGGVRLRLDQREHEVQQRVVELVQPVGGDADVARASRPRQLQPAERQPEDRILRVGGRRRDVDVETDGSEVRLAGHGRRRVDCDRRGDADAAARRAEQQRDRDGGAALLLGAEERHGERGGRDRRARPHRDAEADVDPIGGLVIDGDSDGQIGLVEAHDRQPDDTARIGRSVGPAHRLVDECDQRVSLGVVGQHRLQRRLGVAEPVRVRVALRREDAERDGEVAEDAEVVGDDAHAGARRAGVERRPLEP